MGVHPVHEALTSSDIKKLLRFKARQLHRRPESAGIDLAVIQQDLAAHVLQQAYGYDPARGTAAGFATAVIDSAAATLCRHYRRFKRAADRPVQSLDESALDADGREVPYRELLRDADVGRRQGVPASTLAEHGVGDVELADVLSAMPSDLAAISRLLMTGKTEAAIAKATGVSRRQVRNSVIAIREHLVRAGYSES